MKSPATATPMAKMTASILQFFISRQFRVDNVTNIVKKVIKNL